MYNPQIVREYRGQEYTGTLETQVKKFEGTFETISVSRPLGFVQRAYTDVECQMRATTEARTIETVFDFRTDRVGGDYTGPIHGDSNPYFEFPIIKCTESVVYKPESSGAGDYFESDPKQLLTLSKLLCSHDEIL